MKRLVSCLFFLGISFLCGPGLASGDGPQWFSFGRSPDPGPPEVQSAAGLPASWEARIAVPGVWAGTTITAAGPRGYLEIPDGAVTNKEGQPLVPVLRYLVECPPGATAGLTVEPLAGQTIALKSLGLSTALVPVQPPFPKLEGVKVPFVEDAAAYAADTYFPEQAGVIAGSAMIRGRQVVLVELHPVRYNPQRGLLQVWTEAVVRLTFEGGLPAQKSRDAARLESGTLDRWLDAALLPSPAPPAEAPLGNAGGAAQGAEGMLVIVNDAFNSAVQPLVEWKRQTGYKVEVLNTSALGGTPSDTLVKNAVQTRFDSWSNPSLGWVLLVGDTDFVPIHTGNGGGSSQLTDNWYACVSGTDYLPDLAIARISTRSAAETQAVVDKLLLYEKATFPNNAWIKKAGFIGTSDSGHYSMIETTHDYCIDTYFTPNGYQQTSWSHGRPSCDRHYYTTSATTGEISSSINGGRSIVNYSGHGSTDSWQGPTSNGGYNQANVNANTNNGMYPFVISNACITGSLGVSECFAETWQKAPNKGAIGFWGASNNSYWDEDDYLQRQLYTHIFPMDATPALGVIVNQTKLDLYTRYGNVGTVAYYFDMYNLLSEPTLSLWTRVPRTLTAAYPSTVALGENTFEVTVTFSSAAVANALVAVRRTADGVFESGYTGTDGKVTFTLDPPPVSVGPLQVTVTKHDFLPHQGQSEVISPNSPWLVHRSHGVDDAAGGDGNGQANPAETIVMPVTVENVGQLPGASFAATLTTTTPGFVEILDAGAAFPAIGVREQATTLPDHFRVQVRPTAPDGAILGFDMNWTAPGGASGTTSFTEMVAAVDFAYAGQSIDDAAGNNDGMAGPGETVDMTISVRNAGHRDAAGIHGVLSTVSPYITLLQDEAGFPDLAAGAAGNSLPPAFRFAVSQDAPDKQPVTFSLLLTEQGTMGGFSEVIFFDVLISSCSSYPSTDVPKTISDNSSVESVLNMTRAIEIGEINVLVDIAHTYIGDLKVSLISPAGTTVALHNRTGGSTDNLLTWYDTQTVPAEPLSAFNGQNSFGAWRLKVEDLAGGDTGAVNGWTLEVCGQAIVAAPNLRVSAHTVNDAGSCNPDGLADVGETVDFPVTLKNSGSSPATGVQAVLSSSSRVTVLNNPLGYPDLAPGQEATRTFRVAVGAVGCLETASFTLSATAAEGAWQSSFTEVLEADLTQSSSSETLERGGAEPAGWTHQALQGTDDWRVVSTKNHTPGGAYSWFASDPAVTKDDVLITPSFTLLGSPSRLDFWHWAETETSYDGGVVEISADNGTTWADLGSQFLEGGYDSSLRSGPLNGRMAWNGTYTAWKHTVVNLDPWSGQTVKFRFRLGCDSSVSRTGWWVDDITVSSQSRVCDAQACGIPGEAKNVQVARSGSQAVVTWWADPLALTFKVWRSSDPQAAANFTDVTGEDPNPADSEFRDANPGPFLCWIIQAVGPDGQGPWGHFAQ